MDRDLDPVEVRVLGCLIEKQRTTPDQYPLSLNALRSACNQTTNRNPIVRYDEELLRAALQKLGRRRYTRLASGHTSRAAKYRHLLDEAVQLDAAEQAVMAVLFLRGEQTPGELKQRTERMQAFDGIAGLQDCLTGLIDKGFVFRAGPPPGPEGGALPPQPLGRPGPGRRARGRRAAGLVGRRPRSSRPPRGATSAWTSSRPRCSRCARSCPHYARNSPPFGPNLGPN